MFWLGYFPIDYTGKRIYGYEQHKYYDIKDIEYSVCKTIFLYTTMETVRLSLDQLVLTNRGDKRAVDVQKGDKLIHPLGYEAIVTDKSNKMDNLMCKLIIDGDDYMQYQSALIRI